MSENVRVCVLDARTSKKRFCCYLNDNFDCTAPTYEYDYCIGFVKRLNIKKAYTEMMNEYYKYCKLIEELKR